VSELGQNPGIDLVGLAGQRRQPPHLRRVSDEDLPAIPLELVAHETGAVHRLDRRQHRQLVHPDPTREASDRVRVPTNRARLHRHTVPIKQKGNRSACGSDPIRSTT
jgi:hypothetical protein